jgi:hypothetical protein
VCGLDCYVQVDALEPDTAETTMSEPRKKMALMARDNDIEGVRRLLDEGVDPAADTERNRTVRPRDDLCLSIVPSFLSLDVTEVLLTTILQGWTALHRAAMKGFLPLARLLVVRAPHLLEIRDSVSSCVRRHVCVCV